MSVDVKKVNSDQPSSKSPNQRKEAFKQKRKVIETNEGKNLRNRVDSMPTSDRKNPEPIYENLRERPVPEKPKRQKNMQLQSGNELSDRDPGRFPDKSPNQRREDFKQKRKAHEKNEGKLRHRVDSVPTSDRKNPEPIYENLRERPVPQKPQKQKNMQLQSENKLSNFERKAEQLKQQILSDYEKNKNNKTRPKRKLQQIYKDLKKKMSPSATKTNKLKHKQERER